MAARALGSMPMGLSLHVAFDVTLEHVMDAPERFARSKWVVA
jgi:hypothetical protein